MYKLNREGIIIIIFDLLLSLFCFWLIRYFVDLPRWYWLVLSACIWAGIGVVSGKLHFREYKRIRYALVGIAGVGCISGFMLYKVYTLFVPGYEYDNSILYASGFIITAEFLFYWALRSIIYKKIPYFFEPPEIENIEEKKQINTQQECVDVLNNDVKIVITTIQCQINIYGIIERLKQEILSTKSVFLESTDPEAILRQKIKSPTWVVATEVLNNVRHCNTLFSYINYSLDDHGHIVCYCETTPTRRERILKQTPIGINHIILFGDYIVNRVFPKLSSTKYWYFKITKGKKRAVSRVEVLGKLYRAGFDVVYENTVGGVLCIIAKKVKEPIREEKPNTGALIRLKRIGKDGEVFGVYKFRTMYAYSEYLQPYIYKQSGLCKGGKIADDYRVSPVGRFLRKTWLDELPMLINWIKGDMKLVGVRPLSNHYFSLYSKELQELRTKVKPGILPPFYADMPETLDEIQESERCYLETYLQHPFLTDWRYFWKIMGNIVLRGKRSK